MSDLEIALAKYDGVDDLVYKALKEMQKREKGCEYCSDLSKYKGFGYAEFFHQTAADECCEISVDVKFCPNCGKELTKERAE